MTLRMPVQSNIGVARETEEVATAVPAEASHVRGRRSSGGRRAPCGSDWPAPGSP
jgi:hypothetical protein